MAGNIFLYSELGVHSRMMTHRTLPMIQGECSQPSEGDRVILKITTEIKQRTLIVRVEGELDMHVADMFRTTVEEALDKNGVKNLILSLADVTFIDSSGLGVILGRYKRISQQGGKMSAVQLQPQVEKIFELSGLLRIMKLYPTELQALQSA
jgi:stage II sporulation protein AA (anti-sigma F factor antagonist)